MKEELQENLEFLPSVSQDVSPNSSISPFPGRYRVMRRNGKVTAYDPHKIVVAMTKAFLSVEGSSAAASSRIAAVFGKPPLCSCRNSVCSGQPKIYQNHDYVDDEYVFW